VLRPARLLFTKVDEAVTPAALINENLRTAIPLSLYTAGPAVPEDLKPVEPEDLLAFIRSVLLAEPAAGPRNSRSGNAW
jgi:flagellar biosynthesis GTPase FlhF